MKNGKQQEDFAVCIYCKVDEEINFGKIYEIVCDKDAEKEGMLGVVDESGEDYLYPKKYFTEVHFSTIAKSFFFPKGLK